MALLAVEYGIRFPYTPHPTTGAKRSKAHDEGRTRDLLITNEVLYH